MKGKWFDIKKEIKEEIDASGYDQKWIMDLKGYFLIRIIQEKKQIEVALCTPKNVMTHIITGDTPESILYKIVDLGFVSRLDHAGYLGKELQKAYLALHDSNYTYIQDSPLQKK